jgi:acetyl-CoA acetyltransferase
MGRNITAYDFHSRVCIVGVGDTDYGSLYRTRDPRRNAYTLGLEAFRNALADCGLKKEEIDGLIVVRIPHYQPFANMVGLRFLRVANVLRGEGRMSGLAVQYAAALIHAGLCSTVAVVYGNDGRSAGATYGGEGEGSSHYETIYGMTSPGAAVALMWRRYMHEYGAPEESLAAVAISNRYHASMNERAVFRQPLTLEEYLSARWIVAPLRLYDYCLINDGGVALILTTAERARDLKKPPVYLTATAACTDLTFFYTVDDFFRDAVRTCAEAVFKASGLGHRDVQVCQIYDNFTPTVIFGLEGAGFCKYGEGFQFVQDSRIPLGGELPVNTSGGHTSESYMQGFGLHVENVRQLRGEAGRRQVPDCRVAMYICPAPVASVHIMTRG